MKETLLSSRLQMRPPLSPVSDVGLRSTLSTQWILPPPLRFLPVPSIARDVPQPVCAKLVSPVFISILAINCRIRVAWNAKAEFDLCKFTGRILRNPTRSSIPTSSRHLPKSAHRPLGQPTRGLLLWVMRSWASLYPITGLLTLFACICEEQSRHFLAQLVLAR